jgi:hypothetical protein
MTPERLAEIQRMIDETRPEIDGLLAFYGEVQASMPAAVSIDRVAKVLAGQNWTAVQYASVMALLVSMLAEAQSELIKQTVEQITQEQQP